MINITSSRFEAIGTEPVVPNLDSSNIDNFGLSTQTRKATLQVLTCAGLETKGILLGIFDEDELMSARDLVELIAIARDDTDSPFSSSYWGELCKQGTNTGSFEIHRGDRSPQNPNKYGLTKYGNTDVKPFAGHLLNWGISTGISLRELLGEPRTINPNESSKVIAKLCIFSAALQEPLKHDEVIDILREEYKDTNHAKRSRILKELEDSEFVDEDSQDTIRLKDEFSESIRAFLQILGNYGNIDDIFREKGNGLIETVINQPALVKQLELKAYNSSSKK